MRKHCSMFLGAKNKISHGDGVNMACTHCINSYIKGLLCLSPELQYAALDWIANIAHVELEWPQQASEKIGSSNKHLTNLTPQQNLDNHQNGGVSSKKY